ncbi:MAG: shikimate dehydrogenase [Planctomycetota bacterium]
MTHLCVSLTEPDTDALLSAIRSLPPEVDMAEVRLDRMQSFDLERICAGRDRPIIVTNRPVKQRGGWQGAESERLATLRRAAELGADYVDVELEAAGELGPLSGGAARIVSYHNFQRMPRELDAVLTRLQRAGADVAKIAARAEDICDVAPLFGLLQRRGERVPLIALAMGEAGVASRILAGKFGAFLTFASRAEGAESAPGQVPAEEMVEMYRFPRINPRTEVYGVVADPVAHSMSPAIHNAAFAEAGLDAVYLPFKVSEPGPFLDAFQPHDLRGLSVTIPHKETMVGLMDEVDEQAAGIGAVNTVRIDQDGRRYGCNTDVAAAVAAIRAAVRRSEVGPMDECEVLIVGAGGAARAIAYGLASRAGRLVIANRTRERAERLAKEFGAQVRELDAIASLNPDILVNATSVGMWPNVDDTPVPAEMLGAGMVVFDAVYNPIRTRLLREAEEAGAATASGMEWFVNQAVAQFEFWTDREAPRPAMERVVRARLEEGG